MLQTTILKSRFSYTLLLIYLLLAPFLLFAGFLLLALVKSIQEGESIKKFYIILITALLIILFFGYTIYYYIKNSSRVKISREAITIGSRQIAWTEITGITVSGKQPMLFLIMRTWQEAVTITLKSDHVIYIWVDFYGNGSQIRQLMEQAKAILQNGDSFDKLALSNSPQENFTERDIYEETFHYHRRSQFRFLSTYIFIAALIFAFFVFNH